LRITRRKVAGASYVAVCFLLLFIGMVRLPDPNFEDYLKGFLMGVATLPLTVVVYGMAQAWIETFHARCDMADSDLCRYYRQRPAPCKYFQTHVVGFCPYGHGEVE